MGSPVRPRAQTIAAFDEIAADFTRIKASLSGVSTEDQLARAAMMLKRLSANAAACALLVRGDIGMEKARARAAGVRRTA